MSNPDQTPIEGELLRDYRVRSGKTHDLFHTDDGLERSGQDYIWQANHPEWANGGWVRSPS